MAPNNPHSTTPFEGHIEHREGKETEKNVFDAAAAAAFLPFPIPSTQPPAAPKSVCVCMEPTRNVTPREKGGKNPNTRAE